MKRVHLIITGDVQGVGYRAWMRSHAQKLDILGWVKNQADGAVEAVCEGQEARLEELISICKKGPQVAWIHDVAVTWDKSSGEFLTFEIKL